MSVPTAGQNLLDELRRRYEAHDHNGVLARYRAGASRLPSHERAEASSLAIASADQLFQWELGLELLEAHPFDPLDRNAQDEFHYRRARYLRLLGRLDEAHASSSLSQATDEGASQPRPYALIQQAEETTEPGHAIELFRQALSLKPHLAVVHQRLCYLHDQVGEEALAEVHGVIAAAISPDADHVVAATLARSPSPDVGAAIQLLKSQGLPHDIESTRYRAAARRIDALVGQASGPIALGESNFARLRDAHSAYIDKSRFIGAVVRASSTVMLFPAPRRFGKSLNLSMLRYFLDESDGRQDLFEDLEVWSDPEIKSHFRSKAIIHFSLKDSGNSSESLRRRLADVVQEQAERMASRLELCGLSPFEQGLLRAYRDRTADSYDVLNALKRLTEWLSRGGRPVWIIIDEYDAPLQRTADTDQEAATLSVLRDFLSPGLKDNPALSRAVLAGVLQVGRESMFSGVNNVVVHPMYRSGIAPWFGFDGLDVRRLARVRSAGDRVDEITEWYDGYRSSGRDVYNPWSVLNFLVQVQADPSVMPQPYWGGAGTPTLAQGLLTLHERELQDDLRKLLVGESIATSVTDGVSLADLRATASPFWSLLLHSGYLTVDKTDAKLLRVPNLETRHELTRLVQAVLEKRGAGLERFRRFRGALLGERPEEVQAVFEDILLRNASSHDVGKGHKNPYHTLLLGMMVWLQDEAYRVGSNVEAGHGRLDLALIPVAAGTGVVLELKSARSEKGLDKAVNAAIEQVRGKEYTSAFPSGCRVVVYGVAAFGKHARVRMAEPRTLNPS